MTKKATQKLSKGGPKEEREMHIKQKTIEQEKERKLKNAEQQIIIKLVQQINLNKNLKAAEIILDKMNDESTQSCKVLIVK